jgi:hypothetical protein
MIVVAPAGMFASQHQYMFIERVVAGNRPGTYFRHEILEPGILLHQLLEPDPNRGTFVFLSAIYAAFLVMNASLW